MVILISLLIGFISGFLLHVIAMKISFKQRTIDHKIKIYDALITNWTKMRNKIYSEIDPNTPNKKWHDLEKLYGESQAYIGEAFLISENDQLAIELNTFNEKFYRQNWHTLNQETANYQIEALKNEALQLIPRLREDIKESTTLNRSDFFHIFKSL